MRWLRFLSRLAFICNLFFLVSVALRYKSFISDPASVSMAVIIGYFLVFLLNPVVNFCYLAVLLVKKKLAPYVATWLAVANFGFLLLQLVYIFFLNDPVHT